MVSSGEDSARSHVRISSSYHHLLKNHSYWFSIVCAPMNSFDTMAFPTDSIGIGPSLSSTMDQNSPILFKRNLELVQREVVRVQGLAQQVYSGINGAYLPGMDPMNTKRLIAELKQAIEHLTSLLRSTGVGALPLLPPPPPRTPAFADASGLPQPQEGIHVPTEAELLEYANESVKTLYDSLKRKQDSAAVVANLLQQGVGGFAGHGLGGRQRVVSGNLAQGAADAILTEEPTNMLSTAWLSSLASERRVLPSRLLSSTYTSQTVVCVRVSYPRKLLISSTASKSLTSIDLSSKIPQIRTSYAYLECPELHSQHPVLHELRQAKQQHVLMPTPQTKSPDDRQHPSTLGKSGGTKTNVCLCPGPHYRPSLSTMLSLGLRVNHPLIFAANRR
ncbi:hypothetical protein NMY22_g10118 [Coprinellus aureogranulatus]|nr:hypothetical protein NMY22_g10118 [Coprinellus aureogranulatus]